jgi:hypothetical protein
VSSLILDGTIDSGRKQEESGWSVIMNTFATKKSAMILAMMVLTTGCYDQLTIYESSLTSGDDEEQVDCEPAPPVDQDVRVIVIVDLDPSPEYQCLRPIDHCSYVEDCCTENFQCGFGNSCTSGYCVDDDGCWTGVYPPPLDDAECEVNSDCPYFMDLPGICEDGMCTSSVPVEPAE